MVKRYSDRVVKENKRCGGPKLLGRKDWQQKWSI